MPFHLIIAILPVIATCLAGSLMLYAWQRREINGARAFSLFMASVFVWCFFTILEQISPSELLQVTFGRAQYFGIAPCPTLWLVFTLRYTRKDKWLRPPFLFGLCVVPTLSLLLALSDHWHGWIWKTVAFTLVPFPKIIIEHGWFFNYVLSPYGYFLTVLGMGILLSDSFSESQLYRKQTFILLCAVLVPFVFNLLYVVSNIELYGLDITPIGFAVTGVLAHLALFSFRFLDISPISYKTVFVNTADAVILLDLQRRIVDLNPSAVVESPRNVSVSTAIGQPFSRLFPDYGALLEDSVSHNANDRTAVLRLLPSSPSSYREQSTEVFREVKVRSLPSHNGNTMGWVIMIRDVTLQKQQQAQLERFAYVDSLTGLVNRRQLELKAKEIFEKKSTTTAHESVALLYVDLNHFKPINDNYGHDVGDAALNYFADCLQRSVRQGDIVARLGGDEFVALLYHSDATVAREVRSRLLKILEQEVVLMGHRLSLSVSIGMAYYPIDGISLSALLRQADKNMYQEKRRKSLDSEQTSL